MIGARPAHGAALASAALVAVAATTAWAQEPPRPIALAVEVPSECRADLAQQILARTPRTRVAQSGEAGRRVGARIVRAEDRYHGAVAIEGLDGQPVVRQVEAPSCDEVVAALALIAALAIDPEASLAPPSPPPPPTPPGQPPPFFVPTFARPDDGTSGEALEVQPALELGFGLATGLAPRVLAGGLLMLELGFPRKAPLVLVRAGGGYWGSGGQIATPDRSGAARFEAFLARMEGCVAFRREALWLAPCATFDLGSLSVEGTVDGDITQAAEASQLWAAPGPALHAGWNVYGPLTVALDGAVVFPLRRDSYVFEEPAKTVHEVPPVAGRAEIHVAVRFR